MADLATAGTAEEPRLAHREWREVVVEHEALVVLAVDVLDLLLVVGGAEGARHQRLGLPAREDDRPVGSRQKPRLGPDGPNLVEPAPVETQAVVEHLVAQHLFLERAERLLGVGATLGVALGERRHEFGLHGVHASVVLDLVPDLHRLAQRGQGRLLDLRRHVGGDGLGGHLELGLAHRSLEIIDLSHDVLDRGVAGVERPHDLGLAHALGAGLDHDDAVVAARDNQVQPACLALLEGRVDHVGAVDQPDADARDRLVERDLSQRQRGRRAGDGQHVGVVFGVGRQYERDDLRLVAPARGEERPDGSVDQPARQYLLLGRPAFALEEPAGNAPRRVRVFTVVDGQR